MPSSQIERKLAAIMFTDIAGYTALSAKDSTKASELVKTQRDTLKPIVEKHGGSWMKEMGDGLLLTFDSATSAVECSLAIQEAAKDIEDLNLRIGIHEGEVIKQDGDVIGDDVNVASRIEPFSAIGGVAISDKIYRAISSNQEFETKYIGKPKLKGVSQKVEVYCITSHGLPETDVSKVSAKLEQESKFNIFALTGGILTAIGVAFWIAVGVFDVSFGSKMEVPSVGILIMKNLGDVDEDFWARGITEDLIVNLAGAGLIRVAPMEEILKINDISLSIKEKAKELDVKHILTSSLHKKENEFVLRCQLIEAESGNSKYANKWSESIDDAPTIVGNLANNILKSLNVSTKEDIVEAPTENVEAYEFYLMGKNKFRKRENTADIEIAQGLLKKAIELDNHLLEAITQLGFTYYNINNDKAIEIFNSILNYVQKIDNKKEIALALNNIGQVYWVKGDNEQALDYYLRSLKISEINGNKTMIGNSFNRIGLVYLVKQDYTNSLEYFNRSLIIQEEIGDRKGMAFTFYNLAFLYGSMGNNDKVLKYFSRSLNIYEEIDDKNMMSDCLDKLGYNNKKIGEYDKALGYYERSLSILEELDSKARMITSLIGIGAIYYYKGYYKRAEEILEKAHFITFIEVYDRIWNKIYLYLTYKNLGKNYNENEIYSLINDNNISKDYLLNYHIYLLMEDAFYLETAYHQVQEKASAMEDGAKFFSYPIPKAIVEEWEKVK